MEIQSVLVVLDRLTPEQQQAFRDAAPGAQFTFCKREEAPLDVVRGAQAIIGNVQAQKVMEAQQLRFMQLSSAGAENYCAPGVLGDEVVLCNNTGAYGIPIAEYMVGCVFSLFKNLALYRDRQHAHQWQTVTHLENKPVTGSTVVCVGAGDIGGNFLSRMKGLGCTTIGVRRTAGEKPDFVDEQVTNDSLDEVLARADVVALCMPHTSETQGMFDARRLGLIKEGAILINVGRGTVLETQALVDLLKSGHLRGAALDVTDPEPLPADHPLWDLENVMITPHACATNSSLTRQLTFENCYHNFVAYLNGEPVASPVDRKTGYRVSRA